MLGLPLWQSLRFLHKFRVAKTQTILLSDILLHHQQNYRVEFHLLHADFFVDTMVVVAPLVS